ncbi:MAG: hypothetical protein IRZ09_04840 [Variibacter sp.]|nr:hypothetical protein [Variibacter sp.]
MRSVIVAACLGALSLAAPAAAETRTFVIASMPDGYGVDQCLATGARCGLLIANAYCQSQNYVRAASFRKVDAAEITSAVAGEAPGESASFVAIECAR